MDQNGIFYGPGYVIKVFDTNDPNSKLIMLTFGIKGSDKVSFSDLRNIIQVI